jgi:antagonist of KipI
MGFRMQGMRLEHRDTADVASEIVTMGSLQVPASGQPILLMADRQTTGGYTVIANVIAADLPAAGQLAPGDRVRFTVCSPDEARLALMAQDVQLAALESQE